MPYGRRGILTILAVGDVPLPLIYRATLLRIAARIGVVVGKNAL